MGRSILVHLFGFRATLIHGDTTVLDRWLWLRPRLPKTRNGELAIDVGCGSGAFTFGAANRGYTSLGLTWSEREMHAAIDRSRSCGIHNAGFDQFDVRNLHERADLVEKFDLAICCENIEHVLDDRKLMIDIARCLKPGGRLLLTTPNLLYVAITPPDLGPYNTVENGGHVRRGYSEAMLRELASQAGLIVERVTGCSGFFSQKLTWLFRRLGQLHPVIGWLVVLPFRPLPPLLDPLFHRFMNWPYFSICLEAYKPRFQERA